MIRGLVQVEERVAMVTGPFVLGWSASVRLGVQKRSCCWIAISVMYEGVGRKETSFRSSIWWAMPSSW